LELVLMNARRDDAPRPEAVRASFERATGEAVAAPRVSREYAEGICAREWFGDVV
jgi:hypothetical protein